MRYSFCLIFLFLSLAACSSGGGGGGGSQTHGDRLRALVPGMERLWQERSRVPQNSANRLAVIGECYVEGGCPHGLAIRDIMSNIYFLGRAQELSVFPYTPAFLNLPRGTQVASFSFDVGIWDDLTSVQQFTERDNVWVNGTGNGTGLADRVNYRPQDQEQRADGRTNHQIWLQFQGIINSGLALLVSGIDATRLSQDGYVPIFTRCGSGLWL